MPFQDKFICVLQSTVPHCYCLQTTKRILLARRSREVECMPQQVEDKEREQYMEVLVNTSS